LLVIERVTFLNPVIENGWNADGRVSEGTYSREEVSTVSEYSTQ
jgi:hypothetical protein